jgi:hypothetical protein
VRRRQVNQDDDIKNAERIAKEWEGRLRR